MLSTICWIVKQVRMEFTGVIVRPYYRGDIESPAGSSLNLTLNGSTPVGGRIVR